MQSTLFAQFATITGCAHPCRATCYVRLLALALVVIEVGAPGLSSALVAVRPGPQEAYLLLVAAGLFTGLLSGMLGIGGALVVVPALYVLLPLTGITAEEMPKVAVASSLVAMIPTALMAAWTQQRHGALDTGVLVRMGPGMVAGAAAGAGMTLVLSGPMLAVLFAAQSIYYGWTLVRPRSQRAPGGLATLMQTVALRCPETVMGPLAASVSACAGMGAGCVVVPYLRARGVSLRMATATSGALNLGVAVGGALAFMLSTMATGTTAAPFWPAAVLLGAGAVLAVPAGVELAHWAPLGVLEKMLGIVTLVGASAMLVRTLVA